MRKVFLVKDCYTKTLLKYKVFGLLFNSGLYQSLQCLLLWTYICSSSSLVRWEVFPQSFLWPCACCLSVTTPSPVTPAVWLGWLSAVPRSRVPLSSWTRTWLMRGQQKRPCSVSRQQTSPSTTPLASCLPALAEDIGITKPKGIWRQMHLGSFFQMYPSLAFLDMGK